MSRTIAFSLEVQAVGSIASQLSTVGQELDKVAKRTREVRKQLNTLNQGGAGAEEVRRQLQAQGRSVDDLRKEYKELITESTRLKQSQKDLRKDFRDLAKDAAAVRFPKGSLADLEQRYRKLRQEIRLLDETALKSKGGQRLISEARQLKTQIDSTNRSIGIFNGNVGNYKSAFSGLASVVKSTVGVYFSAQAIFRGLQDAVTTIREFEQSLAELQSILGVTDQELQFFGDQALLIGRNFGTSAKEIADGFALIGSKKPDLLEDAAALAEVTKQADILANAAGLTLPEAADALTKSLNQFQAPARDASKFVDILATSQQRGTARIEALSASLKNAGAVANAFGLSFEDTNVVLQALAKGGQEAEEAGTKLRTFLLKLAATGDKDLNPALNSTVSILETLKERYTDQETGLLNVTELTEIFGDRAVVAATTLIGQIDAVKTLDGNLLELGNALGQANNNTNTLDGSLNKLGQAYDALILSLEGGEKRVSGALKGLTDQFTDRLTALQEFNDGNIGFGQLIAVITGQVNPQLILLQAELERAKKSATGLSEESGEVSLRFSDNATKLRAYKEELEEAELALSGIEEGTKGYEDALRNVEQLQTIVGRLAGEVAAELAGTAQQPTETIASLKEEQKKLREELESTAIGTQEFDDKLEELIDVNNRLDKATEKLRKSVKKVKEEVEPAAGSIDALNKKIRELTKDFNASADERERLSILNQIDELKEELRFLQTGAAGKIIIPLPGLDDAALEEGIKAAGEKVLDLDKQIKAIEELQQRSNLQLFEEFGSNYESIEEAEGLLANLRAQFEKSKFAIEQEIKTQVDITDSLRTVRRLQKVFEDFRNLEDPLQLYEEVQAEKDKALVEDIGDIIESQQREIKKNAGKYSIGEEYRKQAEKAAEAWEQLSGLFVDIAGALSQAITDAQISDIEREEEARIAALEARYEREIDLAGDNAEEQERLEKKLERERKKIEKDAAKEKKRLALIDAAIQVALSIIEASPDPIRIAGAIAIGAIQTATIAAQQFWKGGKVKPEVLNDGKINARSNVKPDAHGDRVLALVKPGEVILNEWQQALLGGAATFKRIGVPGFAAGGAVGSQATQTPFVVTSTIQGRTEISPQSIEMMSRMVAGAVLQSFGLAQEGLAQSFRESIQEGLEIANRNRERRIEASKQSTY